MNTHIAGRDPALAETVAWLYGKKPTQSWPDDNESAYEFGRSDNGDWHRVSVWQNGQAINITVTDTLDPDQAVEAARALLTAAEKAGHPIVHIAKAAGVSRETIYQITKENK